MTRFYANLLGRRADLPGPLPKAEALHEAKQWVRGLSVPQAEAEMKRLDLDPAAATRGGQRKAAPAVAAPSRPFEHPYYWAAFILIGDPD
jgi:CHAT domain-containing protein